jgi:hypothetical protein
MYIHDVVKQHHKLSFFLNVIFVLLVIDNGKNGLKKMQSNDALLNDIRNR